MIENEAASNTERAFTPEDPNLFLRTGSEAEAFPGQRDGCVQRPPLLSNVVQDPGQKYV